MGKRIVQQRRGRGTPRYKTPSNMYQINVHHRKYDDKEKNSLIYGKIIDILHYTGFTTPLIKIVYEDGVKIYNLAPEGVKVNDIVASGVNALIQPGNTLPLKNIEDGSLIYNIEIQPGDGGKLVRTSGVTARVIAHLKNKVTIRLPSKKQKILDDTCRATIGVIAGGGRVEKPFVKAGKRHHAMKSKHNLYPITSGVAMNAVDHPFGSGRGRHKGKPNIAPRNAPPGRKVGILRPSRTGKRK